MTSPKGQSEWPARPRRAELVESILAMGREHGVMTRSQIIALSGAKEEPTRHALQQLRLSGAPVVKRHGSVAEWMVAK